MIFCVVTYNQPKQLERLYKSLLHSWGDIGENNFIIINNHSNFKSPGPSKIFHNTLRPNSSLGYLSRSWNQCILHGFGSSNEPRSDWICLVQSDVVFQPGWRERFQYASNELGNRFLACGPGDQAVFIHIEAFRKIGWWDERFCGIGYHEFDYFLRAYVQMKNRAALQGHGRSLVHNWKDFNIIDRQREDGSGHTSKLNPTLFAHLVEKWGLEVCRHLETSDPYLADKWRTVVDDQFDVDNLPSEYNWYPHFYMDDTKDYRGLYKAYTPLSKKTLDVSVVEIYQEDRKRPGNASEQSSVSYRIARTFDKLIWRR